MSRPGIRVWAAGIATAGLAALLLVGCSGKDGEDPRPAVVASEALPSATVRPADITSVVAPETAPDGSSAAQSISRTPEPSQPSAIRDAVSSPTPEVTAQPSPVAGGSDDAAQADSTPIPAAAEVTASANKPLIGTPVPSPTPATGVSVSTSPEATSEPSPVAASFATPVTLERPTIDPELVAAIPTLGRQLAKDDIRPIYNPVLVTAEDSPMLDNDFVLGLEVNGEAHAYPIRLLNGREMVNDVVGGVPVLATW